MLVFNIRSDQSNDHQALTRSIEAELAAYAVAAAQGQQLLLLPSFTADFSRPEAGKALALHLVAHMRPLEAEVPLVPDRYRCVLIE
jgi:hypothetical protein